MSGRSQTAGYISANVQKANKSKKKPQNKTKQMNMKRECLQRVRLQKKVAKPNSESLQGMCLIFQVVIYIAYSECSVWRKVSRGVKGSCEELEQTGNSSLN